MSKRKHEHVNHERWLISYADFITLLFAFFVVLFSTSQSDRKKVQQVEYSIHSAFQTMGVFALASGTPNPQAAGGPSNASIIMGDDLDASPKTMADLTKMKSQLDTLLSTEIAHKTVSVKVGRDGLIISLRAAGFFESGSAKPILTSKHTLLAIGSALAITPYDVRIEGHTDNVPIHNGAYQSNWELSTGRATELTQLFIENNHLVPAHLSAAGYAEYHPIASNATEAGRNRNRRVDIIVIPHVTHHEELWMEKPKTSSIAVKNGASLAPTNLATPAALSAVVPVAAAPSTPRSIPPPPFSFFQALHATVAKFTKPSPDVPLAEKR